MPADILTVTLNPTLDVSTSVDRLINHAKLRCSTEQEQVGGGGINVAQVIHSLGGHCQAMLPAGGTRGQEIMTRLNDSGLSLVTTTIDQQNRECFNVFESSTGHEYRFVLPGPTLSVAEQDACIAAVLETLPTQFLVLSGSLPPGVPDDFYAQLIRAVRAKAPHLPVVLDASGQALRHALDAGVYLFKPSGEELGALIGQTPATTLDCVASCRALIRQGKAQIVALTLGAQGSIMVTDTHAWQVKPLPVPVTSTVGAGDSFVGGLVWSLTQTPDLEQAARIATACSGAALQTQGALRFDKQHVLSISQSVQVEPVSLPAAR